MNYTFEVIQCNHIISITPFFKFLAHCEQIASNRTPEPFQRWNVIPNTTISKLENSSKKELTYSYSSSDEENDAESLTGSFGRPNVSK